MDHLKSVPWSVDLERVYWILGALFQNAIYVLGIGIVSRFLGWHSSHFGKELIIYIYMYIYIYIYVCVYIYMTIYICIYLYTLMLDVSVSLHSGVLAYCTGRLFTSNYQVVTWPASPSRTVYLRASSTCLGMSPWSTSNLSGGLLWHAGVQVYLCIFLFLSFIKRDSVSTHM